MCLTCGCMDAHREMGEANITYEDIKRAADENGRSVKDTLRIFDETVAKDEASTPRSTGRRPDRPHEPRVRRAQAKNGGEVRT